MRRIWLGSYRDKGYPYIFAVNSVGVIFYGHPKNYSCVFRRNGEMERALSLACVILFVLFGFEVRYSTSYADEVKSIDETR